MYLEPTLKVISDEMYPKIHEASLKILKETGYVYESDAAVDVLKKAGAKVDGNTVFLPEKMVEDALKLCNPTFKWHAPEQSKSVIVGKDLIVQPNSGPEYIQDLDEGKRHPTLKDFGKYQILCQHYDIVSTVGSHPIWPAVDDMWYQTIMMVQETIKHTNKPIIGVAADGKRCHHQMDIMAMAQGATDFKLKPCSAAVGVNPLSPLRWAEDVCESIMAYAERSQIVLLLPCIMGGITGPISLMELVILQNVEILSGIVLAKTVNPQSEIVFTPGSSVGYMKKGSYITGTPEMMLVDIAGMQMGKYFYKVPTRTMCGMTDSKTIDVQAGYETLQNILMAVLGGADFLSESLGVLDSIMTSSFEKFIIDIEIIERAIRIKKGIDGFDLSTSIETIQEVGHYGSYLTCDNTFEHFRERWEPSISYWDSYEEWETGGCEDIIVRANRIYRDIIANAPKSMISEKLDSDINKYIANIVK